VTRIWYGAKASVWGKGRILSSAATLLALLSPSCSQKTELPALSRADSLTIAQDNLAHRAEVDSFFRYDPGSPFVRDSSIEFHGIQWFPVNPKYRGTSLLHRFEMPDTVIVMGTRGEQRKQLRYGYFELPVPDNTGNATQLRLIVYKFTPHDGQRYALYKDYLSVWFTDNTTGEETYDVGRYLEIGTEDPDPSHVYVVDFNKAYNPYCAYSTLYSCAIPREEDHLNIALPVGEKKYHH
jgi:uncharacterized protein (DUF1684 family)